MCTFIPAPTQKKPFKSTTKHFSHSWWDECVLFKSLHAPACDTMIENDCINIKVIPIPFSSIDYGVLAVILSEGLTLEQINACFCDEWWKTTMEKNFAPGGCFSPLVSQLSFVHFGFTLKNKHFSYDSHVQLIAYRLIWGRGYWWAQFLTSQNIFGPIKLETSLWINDRCYYGIWESRRPWGCFCIFICIFLHISAYS